MKRTGFYPCMECVFVEKFKVFDPIIASVLLYKPISFPKTSDDTMYWVKPDCVFLLFEDFMCEFFRKESESLQR